MYCECGSVGIAHVAHPNNIGLLLEQRTQTRERVETYLGARLCLSNMRKFVLYPFFNRRDREFGVVELVEQRVEGGCLAAVLGANNKDQPRLCSEEALGLLEPLAPKAERGERKTC